MVPPPRHYLLFVVAQSYNFPRSAFYFFSVYILLSNINIHFREFCIARQFYTPHNLIAYCEKKTFSLVT
jgi:hypothetical protein